MACRHGKTWLSLLQATPLLWDAELPSSAAGGLRGCHLMPPGISWPSCCRHGRLEGSAYKSAANDHHRSARQKVEDTQLIRVLVATLFMLPLN